MPGVLLAVVSAKFPILQDEGAQSASLALPTRTSAIPQRVKCRTSLWPLQVCIILFSYVHGKSREELDNKGVHMGIGIRQRQIQKESFTYGSVARVYLLLLSMGINNYTRFVWKYIKVAVLCALWPPNQVAESRFVCWNAVCDSWLAVLGVVGESVQLIPATVPHGIHVLPRI